MNTEIFDYFKALSKKENFFLNFLCVCLSIVIIVMGIWGLINGASIITYTIMFGCATFVLWLNAFKFFKAGSKNWWMLALIGLFLCAITGIGVYALVK